jgi:SAM-dependent methyltransferase
VAYEDILHNVDTYYSDKIKTHGTSHWGVDWNSPESQVLRFDQLLKVSDPISPFSINDYGCGYGALAMYLQQQKLNYTYYGFDISQEMICRAREFVRDTPNCIFFSDPAQLALADYTVASGIFNVKMGTEVERWKAYVVDTLNLMASKSRLGFAFNMLTSYSDADRMRPDLYYGDPLFYFDYCRKTFSRNIALLHDYGLYEFTLIVRLA